VPSTGVRLTAGRHGKGKKQSPQERGDFFSEDPIWPPGIGVCVGGGLDATPDPGVVRSHE
jgi:hypothetical protein